MVGGIDHIGIAVHSIEAARRFFEEILGLQVEDVEEVAEQGVRLAFLPVGNTRIELLEPLDDTGPVARYLARHGEGVHHIAYRVADIDAALTLARRQGYRLIHETPVPGAHGMRIAFFHPAGTHGVLTEICALADDPVHRSSDL